MDTPYQPTLPPETAATDAELNFIDESPPEFFPENGDSNVGLFRKIFSDKIQEAADELSLIYSEKFINTSSVYLDEWEKELEIPIGPSISTETRKARLNNKIKQGPFTRQRIKDMVEQYIQATFGAVPAFGPSGIPILSGIVLHAAAGVVSNLYRIYEDAANFANEVRIDSTVTVDTIGLARDLELLTPAGITFSTDYTRTGTALIDWGKTVTNFAPSGWWRLGISYDDYSGLGQHGTVVGAPTVIAAPGLVSAGGADGGRDFDGSTDYVNIGDSAPLNSQQYTVFAIIRLDVLPTGGNTMVAKALGNNVYLGVQDVSGVTRAKLAFGPDVVIGNATALSAGTAYTLTGVVDGVTAKLFINGVLEASQPITSQPVISGSKAIARSQGGSSYFNGGLDEIIHLGYPLNDEQSLYLHNQAKNIL